ncbi:MAG: hypothetical protein MUF64_32175 [Polyangiaceae bacterium]|jgi:hypothetical protein|nr:hypothetical protein [Polyangiaceae bacterium]
MPALRPHFARTSARVLGLTPIPGDGLAVLTSTGFELLDASLSRTRIIEGEFGTLTPLADGRFVATASLDIFAPDWSRVRLDGLGRWVRSLVPTASGFFAAGEAAIVVDHAGTRRRLAFEPERFDAGVAAWHDGLVLAGKGGLTLLGPAGEEQARTRPAGTGASSREHYLTGNPVVLDDHIVVPALNDVRVYDAHATLVSTLTSPIRRGSMVPFAGGVLAMLSGGDEGDGLLAWWRLQDGQLVEVWRRVVERPGHVRIAGDFAVIGSKEDALVMDRAGTVRARMVVGHFHDACIFDDGVAVIGGGARWWRPEHGETMLPHDATPAVVSAVPRGLATAEGDVVYLWRADLQGPEPVPLVHDMPFERPIVVEGRTVILETAGRFALKARVPAGMTISPGPWRELTSREEAERVVSRLLGRTFDASILLPAAMTPEEIAQLPLLDVADLHGRALFAPETLDASAVARLAQARQPFFGELSKALGVPARTLAVRIRAGVRELIPPHFVGGYEYLGAFSSSGLLIVADPCHVQKDTEHGLALALSVRAEPGSWHVFVRNAASAPERNAELVAAHAGGFEASAVTHLGSIGVDAGCAGVFDAALRANGVPQPYEEGTVLGLGALVRSGYGDGGYPVFVARQAAAVVKVRIVFIDDDEAKDRFAPLRSSTVSRPYRPSSEFSAGDIVEHPKFGTGVVARVMPDGKIEVHFGADTRMLVHKKN